VTQIDGRATLVEPEHQLKGFAATTPVAVQREDRVQLMTSEIDEFRSSLVAAVQAELERHAAAVVAEVDRVREEGKRERAAMRADVSEQLKALAHSVEQAQIRTEAQADRSRQAFEQRLTESEARQTRRIDDVASGIDGLVAAAARPLLQEVKADNEAIAHKVDGLDTNLRKFDEQAARMVTYFNDMTQQMEQRQDELSEAMKGDIATRIATIQKLVEDNDSAIRRFQNEVGQSTSQKINDAEDRFNGRLLAAESRMKEDAGQKIADIDAHVGRVSSGLDDTMLVLNDRIAAMDTRFVTVDRRLDEFAEAVKGVDPSALDELRDKMSSAVGEAMLVRIEMERLGKSVSEQTDTLSVRITGVETQLQDATMDVSTAVQLDRLEEIERALVELNPDQFVRKAEFAYGSGDNKVLKNPGAGADASSEGVLSLPDGLANETT
jgi:hypothetical protein